MKPLPQKPSELQPIHTAGVILTAVSVIAFAIINYYTWTTDQIELPAYALICWTYLYVPLFLFHRFGHWKVYEFGFVLNGRVILICTLSLLIVVPLVVHNFGSLSGGQWRDSLIEAYARTGEELFFRGFIYLLVLKIVADRKYPWIWAVIFSSIAFSAVHTQILLPENQNTFSQVLLYALIMASLRYYTGSILPGVIIHCALGGGPVSVVFGIAIYLLFVFLSHRKGEDKSLSSKR